MADGLSHLFHQERDLLVPSDLVRGPWDHGLQHGGAVCAALAWVAHQAIEADDPGCAPPGPASPPSGAEAAFQLCRFTTEILRPVPVAPLTRRSSVVRRGRRSRVVEAGLLHDDRLVARATSQWSSVTGPAAAPAPPASTPAPAGPTDPLTDLVDRAVWRRPATVTDPGAAEVGYPRPGFNCDVFELRCLVGSTESEGPGIIWTRPMVGTVADSDEHPTYALAALADLANAVGWQRSPNGVAMINPDVTLQLVRYPRGPWSCIEARATAMDSGIGMMETTLWDGDGRFGRVLSTTVEAPVSLAVDL